MKFNYYLYSPYFSEHTYIMAENLSSKDFSPVETLFDGKRLDLDANTDEKSVKFDPDNKIVVTNNKIYYMMKGGDFSSCKPAVHDSEMTFLSK